MCKKKKWIISNAGKLVFVKCGHCKSCKQERANNIARRIGYMWNPDNSTEYDVLFCNLTYRNHSVPYVTKQALIDFFEYGDPLHVYRDSVARYVWNPEKRETEFRRVRKKDCIDIIYKDEIDNFGYVKSIFNPDKLPTIKRTIRKGKYVSHPNKVSVCLVSEAQRFVKRLKIILTRSGYDVPFKYFYCTEYGETTSRCHLHFLAFVPKGFYDIFQHAIMQAWPFMDSVDWQSGKKIQRAIRPALYLASYCNSPTNLPPFFDYFRPFKSAHIYSQGFGLVFKHFGKEEIKRRFYERDFRYPEERIIDGQTRIVNCIIPKYVISRYFPKFKGYCNLTPEQIFECARRPSYLLEVTERTQQDPEQVQAAITMLRNKRKFWSELDIDEFARMYSDIWSIWTLQNLSTFYKEQAFLPEFEQMEYYDNIHLMCSYSQFSVDKLSHIPSNPNDFRLNIERTNDLEQIFDKRNKTKRAKHAIYSEIDVTF